MQAKNVVLIVLMIIAYRICQQLIYRYSLMTHHNTNPSTGHSVIDNDFAMALRTSPEDDDWQKVRDAKKRKQIQDRLAQRARRECTYMNPLNYLLKCHQVKGFEKPKAMSTSHISPQYLRVSQQTVTHHQQIMIQMHRI